jgi:hypothetical protein
MWIDLSEQEINLIAECLKHCNLHGMHLNLRTKLIDFNINNPEQRNKNAVKAAQTYFSADDLIIEDDYVKWTDEGDALVMAWQKTPKEYIIEEDCGCGK